MMALVIGLLLQSLISPDQPMPQWRAEKRGDAFVVRHKAQAPVEYGYTNPYSPDLVVSCLPDAKTLGLVFWRLSGFLNPGATDWMGL
jgi:hypothetical protein